jgi:hypothetical protein
MLQRLLDHRQRGARAASYSLYYWYSSGSILKDGRLGSVVEVVRFQDTGITFGFDLAGLAEFYGMEFGRIFVDHCLPQP